MPTARFRRSFAVLLLLTLLALSVARASESPTPAPSPDFDQWLLAPIRVHLLQSTNIPAIHTTLKEADIERILKKVNAIWSQAGISFWIESVVRETATTNSVPLGEPGDLETLLDIRPMDSRDPGRFHVYFVKYFSIPGIYLGPAIFVKDSAQLRYIPGIAGGGADEALPKVVAHELGHALSLEHVKFLNRVMMDNATTGTNLSPAEIFQARSVARKITWIKPAPSVLKSAESYPKDSPAARALFRRLAIIPLDHPQVRRAREQAADAQ